MIYYIHGFNSAGNSNSNKVQELKAIFKTPNVEALNYKCSWNAHKIMEELSRTVKGDLYTGTPIFLGTSLGGFFSDILSEKFNGRAALFNPCFRPSHFLKKYIGENKNFKTEETYLFTEKILKTYEPLEKIRHSPKVVFAAQNDDVIPAKEVTSYYEAAHTKVVQIEGGHRISSFLPYTEKLLEQL